MGTALDGILTKLDEITFNPDRTNTAEKPSRTPGGDLGKDEFLQLLVCQMKNQDPLEPEKDTDFIAQLAQFSALQQMQNLNETVMNSQAFSLVGKYVLVNTTGSDGKVSEVKGVVDYVTLKNGETYMSVNGQLYSIDQLVEVRDSFYAVQEFLPTAKKTEAVYDKSDKKPVVVEIDLGKGSYAANSVAVVINGEYVKSEYLKYEDGKLSILPGALDELEPGDYQVGLYFDDPYNTSVTDKVTIKVTENGTGDDSDSEGEGENEGEGSGEGDSSQ